LGDLRIRVVAGSEPAPDVHIYRQVAGSWEHVGTSDEEGIQDWHVEPDIFPLTLLFKPPSAYWDRYVTLHHELAEAEVSLEPLGWAGPTGWWHQVVGSAAGRPRAGHGIRVGVVDTGCGPSPCLEHVVGVGAWIAGTFVAGDEEARDLVSNHGTHVTGLIAGRECALCSYAGIAPAAAAFVVRVFDESQPSAGSDDIASAIETLVHEHHVHLVNVSLGFAEYAEVARDAIEDALDHGVLVLAAAGNHGGSLHYPAAYAGAVAVGALGKVGEGSEFARAGQYVADGKVSEGGFYIAEFSASGPALACVAPGVDVISTVPSSPIDAAPLSGMCGTSMATPIACGALAVRLARDRVYMSMEPTRARAVRARKVLLRSCRDLGLEKPRQGAGLPTVP
jgi:subtilisin